jgi:TonB-dependent SusC/RagA subfamily outer membrane receptor
MTKKMTLVISFLATKRPVMKMITMLLLFGTILAFIAPDVSAAGIVSANDLQQKKVAGKITDKAGAPLPGVNVLEKGTMNGAITDAGGNFSLTVASPSSVLTCSFIGYMTREIPVGDQTTVNIVMDEAVTAMDEIVVVGYSTQARKSLTGAVSTVSAAALAESAASNPVLNQHTPGEGSTLRIRGMTTINDANPLFVVDGIPGGNYSPNDVESMTILKDAAAQSIYGARAANGVVLVTTKSGKKNQKINMTVNIRQGISRNSTNYDLLNTQEWGEMLWLEAKNAGITNYSHVQFGNGATPVIPDYIFPTKTAEGSPLVDPKLYDNKMATIDGTDTYLIAKSSAGTDWMKEAEQDAPIRDYTIDVTGGSANTTYAFLLGYTKEDGVFKWTGFDRYSY